MVLSWFYRIFCCDFMGSYGGFLLFIVLFAVYFLDDFVRPTRRPIERSSSVV